MNCRKAPSKAVHDVVVAAGYRTEAARELSLMYSLGVYTVPLDTKDEKHKYFCIATAGCRQNKTVVRRKGGDFPTRAGNCALYALMEK